MAIPTNNNNWYNNGVLFVLEVGNMDPKTFFSKYVKKVSSRIVLWNTQNTYNRLTTNCQNFSNDILNALDMKVVHSQKMLHFILSLGNLNPKELLFVVEIDGKKYKFGSHSELEALCMELADKIKPQSEDRRILEACDRAFWMRLYSVSIDKHMKENNEQLRKELIAKYKCEVCFFGDPHHFPKLPKE